MPQPNGPWLRARPRAKDRIRHAASRIRSGVLEDVESGAWWPERDLEYVVNARGSADTAFPALLDAVQRSSAAWTDVACAVGPRGRIEPWIKPMAQSVELGLSFYKSSQTAGHPPAIKTAGACQCVDRRG